MREGLTQRFRENGAAAFYSSLPDIGIREPLGVVEWAEKHRRIGQGGSPLSMHGDIAFDVSVMPWCEEPMLAARDMSVSTMCMQWGSGLGKTDGVVSNIIGWAVTESPRNIMALYPNEAARDKWSRDVLQRTIDSTPVLRSSIVEKKGRESGNTISYKSFPGGSLYATAAGSPSNLRGPRVGLAYAGEVDAMPDSVGREGDPLTLLYKRCEGFEDSIKIAEGTPTIKGRSRIEGLLLNSDYRKWFVPCRKCGHRFVIMFGLITWPKGKHHLAELECEKCNARHSDEQRKRISREGQWKPTQPFNGHRGYWLNAFVTTLPAEKGYKTKMHQWAMEWHDACHSANPREKKRVFINTVLAETDEDDTTIEAKQDWEPLYARREPYISDKTKEPILPEPVRVITAGADVQQNRIEILFQGWGKDEQCWNIEHVVIHGSPAHESIWDEAERVVQRRFMHPSGAQLETTLVFIDRGDETDAVDRFAQRRTLAGKVHTCKGASENGRAIVGKSQKTGRGGWYFRLGTDAAKEYIYGKLAMDVPVDGKSYPPGFIHFPQSFEPDFFKQLTEEQAQTVYERGKQYRKFVKIAKKAPNEALDMSVYSLAAFRLRRWDWAALDESIAVSASKPKAAPKPQQRNDDEEDSFATGWRKR